MATTDRTSPTRPAEAGAGTVKFKSSYGTGFRAPSLYEISYNNSFFAFPPASDTELKEEKSRGFDLGVEYYGENGLHLEGKSWMATAASVDTSNRRAGRRAVTRSFEPHRNGACAVRHRLAQRWLVRPSAYRERFVPKDNRFPTEPCRWE